MDDSTRSTSTSQMRDESRTPIRVGLAGFGTVGQELARRIARGDIPGIELSAVSARDLDKAKRNLATIPANASVTSVQNLPDHCEVIVECATGEAFPEIAEAALEAGRTLVPVSVGALAAHPEIIALAETSTGTIRVASGALAGLDALRGAAEGTINSVKLTSRLRPESLAKEAYIINAGYDFSDLPKAAVKVFEGSAGEAARAFPKHFNVAVTLSLAGIGFERTNVEVWADPETSGAVHNVEVDCNHIQLSLTSRNLPSATNPRTSQSVAPSVMAALRSMVASIQVGS